MGEVFVWVVAAAGAIFAAAFVVLMVGVVRRAAGRGSQARRDARAEARMWPVINEARCRTDLRDLKAADAGAIFDELRRWES